MTIGRPDLCSLSSVCVVVMVWVRLLTLPCVLSLIFFRGFQFLNWRLRLIFWFFCSQSNFQFVLDFWMSLIVVCFMRWIVYCGLLEDDYSSRKACWSTTSLELFYIWVQNLLLLGLIFMGCLGRTSKFLWLASYIHL